MVVFHIYATYQPHMSYGYLKKSEFGIQNGCQAAILDLTDLTFRVQVGPMRLHTHTKFADSSLIWLWRLSAKTDSTDDDDDGRL